MTNKEILKKKIIYRSTHRGSKEMDLLIGNFVKKNIDTFNDKDLLLLKNFIEIDDEILKALYFNTASNNFILLKRYDGEDIQADNDNQLEEFNKNSDKIRICVLDLETTGLSHDDDEVIEIAMKLIEVDKKTGNYTTAVKQYECYNQPKKLISEEITALTGITNEMVKGKKISTNNVKEFSRVVGLVVEDWIA